MQLHEMDGCALKEALARRETSSVEIVRALIARRRDVDGRIGAFIARLDQQAMEQAESADRERKSTTDAQSLPPLHGLPMTVKDNIEVAGTDATLGVQARVGRQSESDALVVSELRRAGAIILGKTNVPQLLLVQETDNAIFGVTRNPWNSSRTPGGSSGGEAAALASGQTPLGIGSDIGGSLRIPAHFSGVCALKPTVDRWSVRGMLGALAGQEIVRAQMGPIARSVRDLWLLMGAVSPERQSQFDPAVAPLPLGSPVSLRGLRIGYYVDDGFMTPSAGIVRAVRQAADALRGAGATLVEYQPPAATDLLFLWLAAMTADGGETLGRMLDGEAICRQLKVSNFMAKMPSPVRLAAAALLDKRGEGGLAGMLRAAGAKSVSDYWQLTAQRTALRRAEFDAWNARSLDAVLCPPHVLPALPIGSSGDLTLTLSYMFRYVLLNFPAGVVPVSRVRDDETTWMGPRGMFGDKCTDALRGSAGLPIGVQVVSRPYREDVALSVMAAIEESARSQRDFPRTPIEPIAG
jgi:fatty acid amide hydrolase